MVLNLFLNHFRLTSAILIVSIVSFQSVQSCNLKENANLIPKTIEDIIQNDLNIISCLKGSLETGNTELAVSIVEKSKHKFEKQFIDIYQQQLTRLELLEEEIILGELKTQPTLKWGQNQSHIFLSMKLSHRWDSPPCLNTKHQKFYLGNDTFEYTNVCVVSHQKITFTTTQLLYGGAMDNTLTNGDDNQENNVVEVKKDGVGTYSAIIEKKDKTIWPFLNKEEKAIPLWSQIAERYSVDHKKYQQLIKNVMKEKKSKPSIVEK